MKKSIPAWIVLTVICVVAAVLLAATNLATKDVIAANAQREALATLGKLLPDATAFETMEDSGISIGKDGSGNIVGYALAATTQGFGGEVETTVAARPDGIINGISVGGSNFAETAGLGARAKEPEFQEQFAGKSAPVSLTKDGGEIEALSGATITSRAVIKGVNEAMEQIAAVAGFTVESTSTAEHLGEGRYAATAQGFGGPVKVFMTLDEGRTITEFSVGDSQFAETPGLGARAQEEAFQGQFIGKTLPVAIGDIEALSGATITTNAVIEAIGIVNDGLDHGLADAPIAEQEETPADEQAEEPAEETPADVTDTGETTETGDVVAAPATAEAGNYSGSAQGFGGPVRVFLTVDENRSITDIRIGDSQFAETDGLGARAKEETYTSQFIGKTLPLKDGDIEAITGATITSNAVLKAIEQINAMIPEGQAGSGIVTEAGDGGNYTASAQGFGGPVRVFLTVDGNRTITAIRIGNSQFAETDGLGARAKEEAYTSQFIGKMLPLKDGDIEAITGATITSTAVLNAISQIAEILP